MMIHEKHINAIFPTLDAGFIEVLESEADRKHFESGSILIKPNQFIRSTILVLEGLIKVYRQDDDGGEFFLYHIGPGQACALSMVCAMGAKTSQISAQAVADTEVMMIPIEKMEQWTSKYKSWNHFIIDSYRQRFEELLQTLDSVAFRNMDERLEFYLKRMQNKFQSNVLYITHQQIAQDLNSSREVISRLLKKLSERGNIILHRFNIEILKL